MPDKLLQVVAGRPTEVEAKNSSAGVADAGRVVALDGAGLINVNMMPTGVAPDTAALPTSEALAAGDYVNIFDDVGVAKVRKADASTANAAKRAHGFVTTAFALAATATIYFEGRNTALTGLVAGTTYVLSHTVPGGVTALASATTTAGHSLQVLGEAYGTTAMNVEIDAPIIRG